MMVKGESYTARQVRDITGVSYETLNYWAKIGLVKPSVSAARGSGTRRVYDFQDLVAIRVALKLRQAGVFGSALIRILNVLRQSGFDSPTKVAMEVTPGGDVEISLGDGEKISGRRRPGQLLLDFECDCREEVAELWRQLPKPESSEKTKPIKKPVKREKRFEEVRTYRGRGKS